MKEEHKDGKVITTQSFAEFFGSEEAAKEIIDSWNNHLKYSYQPERLNPEDVRNNVCDSPNSEYK